MTIAQKQIPIMTITIHSTVEGMGLLAMLVAIRTIIGWTTVLEMEGRWPWQKPRAGAAISQTKS